MITQLLVLPKFPNSPELFIDFINSEAYRIEPDVETIYNVKCKYKIGFLGSHHLVSMSSLWPLNPITWHLPDMPGLGAESPKWAVQSSFRAMHDHDSIMTDIKEQIQRKPTIQHDRSQITSSTETNDSTRQISTNQLNKNKSNKINLNRTHGDFGTISPQRTRAGFSYQGLPFPSTDTVSITTER